MRNCSQAQFPQGQLGGWNLLHEAQSAHEQRAGWARMAHAKQEQPAFAALFARCHADENALAVRLTKACWLPTAVMTSACAGSEGLMLRAALAFAGGVRRAEWQCCASPAKTRKPCS